MDQITAILEGIDFDAIMSWLTDLITQIDIGAILQKLGEIIVKFIG